MKIPEVTIFGYATKGEALEVANAIKEEIAVAAINIMSNGKPAEKDVCYIIVPLTRPFINGV